LAVNFLKNKNVSPNIIQNAEGQGSQIRRKMNFYGQQFGATPDHRHNYQQTEIKRSTENLGHFQANCITA